MRSSQVLVTLEESAQTQPPNNSAKTFAAVIYERNVQLEIRSRALDSISVDSRRQSPSSLVSVLTAIRQLGSSRKW